MDFESPFFPPLSASLPIKAISTETLRGRKKNTSLEFSCTKTLPDNSVVMNVAMNAEHFHASSIFPKAIYT